MYWILRHWMLVLVMQWLPIGDWLLVTPDAITSHFDQLCLMKLTIIKLTFTVFHSHDAPYPQTIASHRWMNCRVSLYNFNVSKRIVYRLGKIRHILHHDFTIHVQSIAKCWFHVKRDVLIWSTFWCNNIYSCSVQLLYTSKLNTFDKILIHFLSLEYGVAIMKILSPVLIIIKYVSYRCLSSLTPYICLRWNIRGITHTAPSLWLTNSYDF